MACCASIDLECFGCNLALLDDGIVSFDKIHLLFTVFDFCKFVYIYILAM